MPDMEKVIAQCEWAIRQTSPTIIESKTFYEEVLTLLKEQETANLYKCPNCGTWVSAENVVRCKDCVECYFASNRIQSEQTFACGKHGIDVTQDWFCADGKRKEGR